MKPFDLEAAQRGDKIMTRDGQEAKFIAYVPEAAKYYQVIALVGNIPKTHSTAGEFCDGFGSCPYDLVMAPKKRTVWVNIYSVGQSAYYNTEELADERGNIGRIGNKAWPLEIEE